MPITSRTAELRPIRQSVAHQQKAGDQKTTDKGWDFHTGSFGDFVKLSKKNRDLSSSEAFSRGCGCMLVQKQ
jgi:hypothetical protein